MEYNVGADRGKHKRELIQLLKEMIEVAVNEFFENSREDRLNNYKTHYANAIHNQLDFIGNLQKGKYPIAKTLQSNNEELQTGKNLYIHKLKKPGFHGGISEAEILGSIFQVNIVIIAGVDTNYPLFSLTNNNILPERESTIFLFNTGGHFKAILPLPDDWQIIFQ